MSKGDGLGTIRTEGGLLSRALLERVAAGDKTLAGMAPEAYHLAPNEKLGEAITRSWNRLVGAWESFSDIVAKLPADEKTATTITRQRWTLLLFQELGYGQLQTTKAEEVGGKSYPVSHAWDHVPIHLVGVRVELDKKTPGVAGAATMSPHSLVQELLNRTDEHLWAMVTNGYRLRLLRDNVALTRQAYVEFDLEAMFAGQAYADFALLWLVCHQSRFEADIPAKCLLEQWTIEADERGTRALDQLRVGVEAAITALGEGFLAHRDNTELRQRLTDGELDKQDYYRQLLRTVYRLLFLFVAEGRDLLLDPAAYPTAKERYRAFYSLGRLRSLADARRGTTHADQWSGLQLVMRALGATGEPALALPGLGSFLWKPHATPDLDGARLDNRHLLSAIRSLSTTTEGGVTRSVDYRNLGAEELGSIYESLLELHPVLDVTGRTFALSTAGGNERKTTGSYYTPTSLITELLDSALEPVLDEATRSDDPEAALLGVTVLDPACGSGHFLIAAAHRIAKRLAAIRSGDGEPAPPLVQAALREVVARCIHGIDVNEMAVELCKVSLWMESMEPGKPLAFLDHRIVCGNSLLGTTPELLAQGLPDGAFKPLTGDEKTVVTSLKKRNKAERAGQGTLDFGESDVDLQQAIAEGYAAIDEVADGSVEDLEAKERRWLDLQHSEEQARARLAADAWCAAFVAPKTAETPAITTTFIRQALKQGEGSLEAATVVTVRDLASRYRFLHLHLAFPHIFGGTGERGFTAVLGNPPWERMNFEERPFFARSAPEITAASTTAARRRMIRELETSDLVLFNEYRAESRRAEASVHLINECGRYEFGTSGRVNTFALFGDQANAELASAEAGYVGLVLPTAFFTDTPYAGWVEHVVRRGSLRSLVDFVNSKPIFVDVHRSYRFSLVTLGPPRSADTQFVGCYGLRSPEERATAEEIRQTWEDVHAITPSTPQIVIPRSSRSYRILSEAHRRVSAVSSPGRRAVGRGGVAITSQQWSDSYLEPDLAAIASGSQIPLLEAKMIHQFDSTYATYDPRSPDDSLPRALDEHEREMETLPLPQFCLSRADAEEFWRSKGMDSSFIPTYRDVTHADNDRTAIAALVANVCPVQPLNLIRSDHRETSLWILGAVNSFAFDFLVRQKISGSHLNVSTFNDMAVPDWSDEWALLVLALVDELSVTPMIASRADRRVNCRAVLDAVFFRLYGIEREDVDFMMETFPSVKRKDEAAFGEYRTKRLILEVYDAMTEAIASGKPYQTILDPPPADPSLCHPESTRPDGARD